MILFIGTESVGHFVPEVSGDKVVYTGEIFHAKDIETHVFGDSYRAVIIDLRQFIDLPHQIVAEIDRIAKAYTQPIIFFALGLSPKSDLINQLIHAGFYYFVLDGILGRAKEQFKQALLGYASIDIDAILQDSADNGDIKDQSLAGMPKEERIYIGIAGCCSRIGTTTQALQICKYLLLKGKKPCYITLSPTGGDIPLWKNLFSITTSKEDISLSRVHYEGIDLYADPEKITEIQAMDYDYIIYDFGDIHNSNFNVVQFLEKSIRIIVSGIAPVEMMAMRDVYNSVASEGVYYIFSFVSTADQKEVLQLQEGLAERTVFAPWAPDPFVYTTKATAIYDKIIAANNSSTTRKKRFLQFTSKQKKREKNG